MALAQVVVEAPHPPPFPGPGAGETWGPVIAIVVVVIAVAAVLYPLARAWARRLEGRHRDDESLARLDAIEQRLGELDAAQGRVLDLEERVDFAERILAERVDQRQVRS
jgi:hypothetical protein